MIIDATHKEETRVALIEENNRLIDFDFESENKLTVKGNIYLAKVARVEPSLQAAFIDYGGNRHGFLSFNEIHPDYFRIPVSDREALKEEIKKATLDEVNEELSAPSLKEDTSLAAEASSDKTILSDEEAAEESFEMPIAILGGEAPPPEEDEFILPKRPLLHEMYKIQEVIHKNQILLVQVVKEERGGKGAALTTFLSIAGRYSVLMPNSPRSGGVSRKISNPNDRARLKKFLEELDLPEGMGLIIRTAGHERTKTEIKRDAEFLMRAWNGIRDLTLQSIAPALIYEEDDIIKRAIRDLYTKDVDEIHVEGEEGYKTARLFMKTLMPSHVKRVHHYKDSHLPLFHKFKVETQIDEMHNPIISLPSGGSIVIHPTEALVSIDINSGRSTRERHIEETAVKTNLEAADEIARQVRLRDLAGLIVIDFIDMEEHRHIAAVERRLREAFRDDRARVQMGKIGPFGLLELSRQRLRPSILETSARPCPHCNATGYVRSTESMALHILRVVEEEALLGKASELQVHVASVIAFYLLNTKREHLQRLESHLKVKVFVEGDDTLITPSYRLVRLKRRSEENKNIENVPSISESESFSSPQKREEMLSSVSSLAAESPEKSSEKRGRNRRPRRHQHNRNRRGGPKEAPPSLSLNGESEPIQKEESHSSANTQQPTSRNYEEGSHKRRHRSRRNRRFKREKNDQKMHENVANQNSTLTGIENTGNLMPDLSPVSNEAPSPEKKEQKKKPFPGGKDLLNPEIK